MAPVAAPRSDRRLPVRRAAGKPDGIREECSGDESLQDAAGRIFRMKTDWIQTYTGKKFFPLKPNPADICIEDIAHSLSMQCRFAGHSKQFYSVAQHCNAMVNCWFPHPEQRELAKYALLHDASEAYLTDIPRPLKHLPEFQFYRKAKKRLTKMIYIKFGLNPVEPSLS